MLVADRYCALCCPTSQSAQRLGNWHWALCCHTSKSDYLPLTITWDISPLLSIKSVGRSVSQPLLSIPQFVVVQIIQSVLSWGHKSNVHGLAMDLFFPKKWQMSFSFFYFFVFLNVLRMDTGQRVSTHGRSDGRRYEWKEKRADRRMNWKRDLWRDRKPWKGLSFGDS